MPKYSMKSEHHAMMKPKGKDKKVGFKAYEAQPEACIATTYETYGPADFGMTEDEFKAKITVLDASSEPSPPEPAPADTSASTGKTPT